MILHIPEILARLLPGLRDRGPLSIACVRTTRPKYLVFGARGDHPTCVAQFGPGDEMEWVHSVLTRLRRELPDLVARPLACAAWQGDTWVQIQSGLPGMPWFRLVEKTRSRREWASLGKRARAALERFHGAVRRVPSWSVPVHPGEQLRQQARSCVEHGIPLSGLAHEFIAEAGTHLDDLGERPHFWQHGDFCLNNLLVQPSELAIIDFEEFGATAMPYHDEIGLALSLNDFATGGRRLLPEDFGGLPELAGWPAARDADYFLGFLLHHLLWRINQSVTRPTRARIREVLVATVEQLATSSHIPSLPR